MSGNDIDLSLLCPQFVPDGLLLNLQVHGNRNSMMQNITYNPTDQDPFLSLYFVCRLTATTFSTTLGAYWFSLKARVSFQKETHLRIKRVWFPQKYDHHSTTAKNALYFLHVVIGFKEAVSVTVHQTGVMGGGVCLAKSCSSLVIPLDGSIYYPQCSPGVLFVLSKVLGRIQHTQ